MNLTGIPEAALRSAGAAFNAALLVACVWLSASLYGAGMSHLEAAGGLASSATVRSALSDPGILLAWVAGFFADPGAPGRAAGYFAAWLAFIGSAGCAWMAILGARWAYHAVLRLLMARSG